MHLTSPFYLKNKKQTPDNAIKKPFLEVYFFTKQV